MPMTPEERRAKKRAYNQAYYAANRPRLMHDTRQYRLRHADAVKERARKYAATHRDTIRAAQALYRQQHRAKLLAYNHQYYAEHQAALTQQKRAHYAKNREQLRHAQNLYRRANAERIRQNERAWYARNRARRLNSQRQRHARYLSRILPYNAQYYQRNRLALLRHKQAYARQNPAIILANILRRRARIAGARRNDLTPEQRTMLIASRHGVCDYCPYYAPDCTTCKRKAHKLTIDHITALARQGDNTLWNSAVCCRSCNSKKGPRPLPGPVQPLLL